MAREDYYSLLGIDRHAPEREIKRAYYRLARDLHPDKAKDPNEARANAERLAVISKAYNTLKDPRKRAEYDGAGSKPPPAAGTSTNTPPPADPSTQAPPTPKPKIPGSGGVPRTPLPVSKVSSADIASQRVLTAQKAFVKGMEYYKNVEYRKALPFFEAAVKNDPESEAQYHMKLATCIMRTRGSFGRAVQAAEKACELEAYNMDYKIGLAEIYETVGIESKAQAVYEEVLKWDADNEKAKHQLELMKSAEKQRNPSILAKIFPSIFGKK